MVIDIYADEKNWVSSNKSKLKTLENKENIFAYFRLRCKKYMLQN